MFEMMEQAASSEVPLHKIMEDWLAIEKIWRLERSDKHNIAEPLISKFSKEHGKEDSTFPEILWGFLNSLFPLQGELRSEIKSIFQKNPSESKKFFRYYKKELKPLHRRSQFEFMTGYFNAYDQHSQLMIDIRFGTPLADIGKATLVDFDKVKAYYANAYEFFAGAIAIYTCLNNIKEGRAYDQLKNITLKKYLDTDKAKRRDSILTNTVFASATLEFDSTIRNGSFHNSFFIKPDNETIEIRSGGTGALKTISYTEYLYQCGMMFKQCCQLFILELEFDQIIKDHGL